MMKNAFARALLPGGGKWIVGAFLLVAGCASGPSQPAAPPLELVSAGTLVLPPQCEPGNGVVYRTAFVVQPDGQVAGVVSESGAGCVQQALQDWVGTFQYRPVGRPTSAVLDWIGVSAARGG